MNKVKRFLEENKIYFETIVMVTLTIAGIFVSISANTIMKKQADIEEALSKPVINLEIVYNDEKDVIEQISIVNDGSAIKNVEIEIIPYYFVSIYKQVDN